MNVLNVLAGSKTKPNRTSDIEIQNDQEIQFSLSCYCFSSTFSIKHIFSGLPPQFSPQVLLSMFLRTDNLAPPRLFHKMSGLEQSLFQLKFTAKLLNRQAAKAAKEELQEKTKTKKALMQGNKDIALLYAQNAIRKANERVNLLRLASRIDAMASRVQTAVTMRSVSGNMATVIRGMDKALQTMNLEHLSLVMDKFENQCEDLDALTNYYESATNNVNALTTPQEEVDELMAQIADQANLEMKQGLNETNVDVFVPPETVSEEREDRLAERLRALRN